MTTSIPDRWGTHPDHIWLRGIRPEQRVQFDDKRGLWHVYGYPEAVEILSDPKVYSSDTARLFPIDIDESLHEGDVTHMDPPEHTKMRTLISSAFTPKVVADLEPRIRAITHELLDAVEGQDRFEFVKALAFPLPVIVIAELLGLPASDRELLKDWTYKITESKSPFTLKDSTAAEEKTNLQVFDEMSRKLNDYLLEHLTERRKRPREDLLTRLVQAEVDGKRLSDNEVAGFSSIVLFAGHITTTLLLGNTLLCLDATPDEAVRVREDRSRVPAVIEETLRFLSPFPATSRATTETVGLGGCKVPADQMLVVWLGAANRDERQFERPDVFDSSRDPNPHIGFSRSSHYCVGAPLARLEGRVALNVLLDRLPTLGVDPEEPPVFFPAMDLAGACVLPVRTA